MMGFLGAILMISGGVLGLLSGVGLARLPSTLTRIHAAAKPASLGLALVALGAGVYASSPGLIGVAALVMVFQFLTAPIAGHLLGRSVADLGEHSEAATSREGASSRRRWPLVLQAMVVWVALWRDLSLANLMAGLIIGVAVTALSGGRGASKRLNPMAVVQTLSSYAVSLVVANLRMARHVLTLRTGDLIETVVVCDLETRLPSVAHFDANAISFSPGTLTLELSEGPPYRMVVHAIGRDTRAVTSEIAELEQSAERMFS